VRLVGRLGAITSTSLRRATGTTLAAGSITRRPFTELKR
jgi:hypothetical protein